ncbi:BTAD domain-containing putative transcriptional regulator [Dongia sp.]|uniref:BTAD domain-containing putative transcriptional regulator n=1 Tax=Dongia sp. TaxID=1977262 RepID=UPI0035B185FB
MSGRVPNDICLLGLPEMRRPVAGMVFPAKGYQLLALLALAPSRRFGRQELASLLWDAPSDTAALTNLRQLLTRLRRAAPHLPDLLVTDGRVVGLGDAAAGIDLCRLLDAAAAAPGEVIALFRGDLLEGITDFTDSFSHWLTVERGRLRERFFAAVTSHLIELTRFGRAPETDLAAVADRLLSVDPEREASYRVLIEAYGRNGMIADAEATYARLTAMLQAEEGGAVQPETAAVYRRVLSLRAPMPAQAAPAASPQQGATMPRVAFLAPAWLGTKERPAILTALIEDVANELARYRTFTVLAPHSSFKLDHDSGMPVDNSKLRADYTVSGFVKPGEQAQVLVLRMADCHGGEIAWAGEFSFAPSELSQSFRLLSLRVASSVAASVERHMFENMRREGVADAYRHYLEGQNLLRNCDLPRLRRARKSFQAATELNRDMALGHARIAQTLYLEWIMRGGNDPELLTTARTRAEHAVDLDPGAGFGHLMSGVAALYQRDFDFSAEKFAMAESMNPNSADLLVQHADALYCLGAVAAGWERFQRAIDLNPYPPDHYLWVGASIAFHRSEYAEAIKMCDRMESDTSVLRLLAASHAMLGNADLARGYARRIQELYPGVEPSAMIRMVPYRQEEHRKQLEHGLRMAGI